MLFRGLVSVGSSRKYAEAMPVPPQRWSGAGERAPRVDAVAQTVLSDGVRGLGLEAA